MRPARALLLAAAAWAASPGLAAAQEWFPRLDFALQGQYVVDPDPRFKWMFDFATEVEAYRRGGLRTIFVAEYEAGAGQQFRRFDVNQGNYLLEGVLLFEVAGVEVGPVWHHVSRHLSDRTKRSPIDWNMLTLRVQGVRGRGRMDAEWRADTRMTVTKANVDYRWEIEAGGRSVYSFSPAYGAVARSSFRLVGVDDTRGRGAQVGGNVEAGIRFKGGSGAAELFVGFERRIDPYPIDYGTSSWFLAGLRLTTR